MTDKCKRIYDRGYRPFRNENGEWEMWFCGAEKWTATPLTEVGKLNVCGGSIRLFNAFAGLYGRTDEEFRELRGNKPAHWSDSDKGEYIFYGKVWKN